jgi:hypothetical protein
MALGASRLKNKPRAILLAPLVPLEILNFTFMLFGRSACLKGAEVAPALGLRIYLARIQAIFAAADFANHRFTLSFRSDL